MLLIISPFLTIVVVLVCLALLSIDILAAARAYSEGESLWSKNQKEAVFHLLRFAETGNDDDYGRYEKAMLVPLGFHAARLELDRPAPDYTIVRNGFLQGGTHPDDVPGVIALYERFRHVSYMKSVLGIWATGDEFIARLGAAAQALRNAHHSRPIDFHARDAALQRIIAINEELRPWQNRFSNTLGDATRWIQSTLVVVVLGVAGTLIPVGIALTQRMVSRVDRAERELKELKLREEYAAKVAYHAAHDPLTNLLNRLEFENRLKSALNSAATQGRHHAIHLGKAATASQPVQGLVHVLLLPV